MIVLPTMHSGVSVTMDQRKKTYVHSFYDHTKSGADIVDQILSRQTTKIKSRRWLINALAFILDTVRTNARVLLEESKTHQKFTTFEFTYQLGKCLVLPDIQRHYENNNGLWKETIQRKRRVLGITEVNRRPLTVANMGMCNICAENIVGTHDYKDWRESMKNKLKTKCGNCDQHFGLVFLSCID